MANAAISKKRKFVQKGVFYAELNDFLRIELEQETSEPGYAIGYAGVIVRQQNHRLEVVIKATRTTHVVGDSGRRIKELKALVQKRFNISGDQQIELFAERVKHRAFCALAQAESVKFRLTEGIAVRRACYRALRFIMENDAKGCEIVVSGKLRGQRAKAQKFSQGYMIASGQAKNLLIDQAVKHVKLRQGVLGIKVKIMLPTELKGQTIVPCIFPDKVTILEKQKSAWEMDASELQKGYAERPAQVEEQYVQDGQEMPEEYGAAPEEDQGYGAPMDPAAGQPMPVAPEQVAADYGYQPTAGGPEQGGQNYAAY